MKDILLSVHPKWCEKICHKIGKDENGKPVYEKVIEVRKSAPKEVPFKCYIYCTQGNYRPYKCSMKSVGECLVLKDIGVVNGKVIGEFVCDKVYKWNYDYCDGVDIDDDLIVDTCLDREDINSYAKGKTLYGWNISDLKIYDKPRELSEFYKFCDKKNCQMCDGEREYDVCVFGRRKPITRPPQSWCYVEEHGK